MKGRQLEIRGQIYRRGAAAAAGRASCGRSPWPNAPTSLAFRLGVSRAHADVRLAKANAYSDVYVLWQPYTFQDNSPYGVKQRHVLGTRRDRPAAALQPQPGRDLPGQDERRLSRSMQLADAERQALIDIEKALQEYEVSRATGPGAADTR